VAAGNIALVDHLKGARRAPDVLFRPRAFGVANAKVRDHVRRFAVGGLRLPLQRLHRRDDQAAGGGAKLEIQVHVQGVILRLPERKRDRLPRPDWFRKGDPEIARCVGLGRRTHQPAPRSYHYAGERFLMLRVRIAADNRALQGGEPRPNTGQAQNQHNHSRCHCSRDQNPQNDVFSNQSLSAYNSMMPLRRVLLSNGLNLLPLPRI